jgi:hypothetical protein
VAAALAAARIGHLAQGVAQGLELGDMQRAAGAAAAGEAGLAIPGEFRRAEQGAGVWGEGFEPESFRTPVGQVVIGVIL